MQRGSRDDAAPFTTLDGSEIRVLLDAEAGGARNQSLAEAVLAPGRSTRRHRHPRSEEIYVILDGGGWMEVDGSEGEVAPGDAVLIPPGARHTIRADGSGLRFLCCCAPPYTDGDGSTRGLMWSEGGPRMPSQTRRQAAPAPLHRQPACAADAETP